jgi:radical SAM superfamily enzyme YgiQ (UPF0313 family)
MFSRGGRKMRKKSKVLFVFSPGWAPVPPIGIPYLSSYLQAAGFETKILDLNVEFHSELLEADYSKGKIENVLDKCVDRICNLSRELNANIIAFTLLDPIFENAMYIAKNVRSILGGTVKIVVGGPHVSYIKRDVLDFKFIDLVIEGEGEVPLLEYVKNQHSNKRYMSSQTILDIDSLPFPDFNNLNLDLYPLPLLFTLVGRGCKRRCAFCGAFNIFNSCQFRSPDNIIGELKKNKEEYDRKLIGLICSLINENPEWLEKLCDKIINEKIEVYWIAQMLPSISKELAEKMYDAGCRLQYISPETGSPKIAKLMNKGIDIKKAEGSFRNVSSAGINIAAWFMVCFPLENYSDMEQTFQFAERIYDYASEILLIPFGLPRNTPIYGSPEKYGIKKIEDRPYRAYCYYEMSDDQFDYYNQLKNMKKL